MSQFEFDHITISQRIHVMFLPTILLLLGALSISAQEIRSITGTKIVINAGAVSGVERGMTGSVVQQLMAGGKAEQIVIASFEVTETESSSCTAQITQVGEGFTVETGARVIFDQAVEMPSAGKGFLLVRSNVSDDRVLIDGKEIGPTPQRLELAVGRHVLRIEKNGFDAWESTVEVNNGENREIFASLGPSGPDPLEVASRADAAFDAGRWDEAEKLYRKVLEIVPDDPIVRERLEIIVRGDTPATAAWPAKGQLARVDKALVGGDWVTAIDLLQAPNALGLQENQRALRIDVARAMEAVDLAKYEEAKRLVGQISSLALPDEIRSVLEDLKLRIPSPLPGMSYVEWTHPYWENLSPQQFEAAEELKVPVLSKSIKEAVYWVVVPKGHFLAGCPPLFDCTSVSSQEQHEEVIHTGFYIMTTEATVAQYFSYCGETKCRRPRRPGWNTSDHAIIGLSKRDAANFCGWLGGRLPTHEEWERAARGGKDGFLYPWGNDFDEDLVNGGDLTNNVKRPGRVAGRDSWPRTSPPGSFPPNGFGLFDVSGNAQEWVDSGDWGDQVRDLRGGSWASQPKVLMIHTRMFDLSTAVDLDSEALWAISGVRCAKDIP